MTLRQPHTKKKKIKTIRSYISWAAIQTPILWFFLLSDTKLEKISLTNATDNKTFIVKFRRVVGRGGVKEAGTQADN